MRVVVHMEEVMVGGWFRQTQDFGLIQVQIWCCRENTLREKETVLKVDLSY